jgi:Zn-dependent protease
MRWSWKLGRFAGIDVFVHATFFLLLGWVGVAHWMVARQVSAALEGIVFILAIFACVVLHEYGHALTARRYGIRTRDITLLPIGGLARLERMPEHPIQELWVALAGPAVNVVIAAVLYVWLAATSALVPLEDLAFGAGGFLQRLLLVNLFLVGFNMLPAFPMDGGRVLRALLATRVEYTRATQTAAYIGQGMALLFALVGLFTNPFLLFIALFVWIGAAQEAAAVQMKHSFGGIPVREAMITDFRALSHRDPIERAVELILEGSQQDFPVLDDERVVGILTRGDLLLALQRHGRLTPVAQVMRRDFPVLYYSDMLEDALRHMQSRHCQMAPVLHHSRLVGLLTAENLGEYLMIQSALGRGEPPPARVLRHGA